MLSETITLQIPEAIYLRLSHTARATQRSLNDIVLHALRVGSPPDWNDAPPEFQADLASMDNLDDETLWKIARSKKTSDEMKRYDELLEKNKNSALNAKERLELEKLRTEADRFTLRKAHAASVLRWRGHDIVNL